MNIEFDPQESTWHVLVSYSIFSEYIAVEASGSQDAYDKAYHFCTAIPGYGSFTLDDAVVAGELITDDLLDLFTPEGDPNLQPYALTIYLRGESDPVVDTINAVSVEDALKRGLEFVSEWYPTWRGYDAKPYWEFCGEPAPMAEAA